MEIANRKYGLVDSVLIPIRCAPVLAGSIVVLSILSGLVPTLEIMATAYFIDTVVGIVENRIPFFDIYLAITAVVTLIAYRWVSREISRFVNTRFELKLMEHLRVAVVEHRAKLAYWHIENQDTWDLISRVANNPESKLSGAFYNLLSMSSLIIRVAGIFILLVSHVWWAALLILAISTPLFLLAIRSGQATYQVRREVSKLHRLNRYLSEVLLGRQSVGERMLFGYASFVNRQWHHHYETARKTELKTEAAYFAKMKAGSIVSAAISLCIVLILLQPVLTSKISIGLFMSLVNGVFGLVEMMDWQLTNMIQSLASHREFMADFSRFASLEVQDHATDPPAQVSEPFESLEFRNVRFRYPGTEKLVLDGLSFTITAGKHYAFVGVNGSGKTTITKLITGLYDNYEGEILLNGKPLTSYHPGELKAYFALVYQDFAKYEISMKDNIALGDIAHLNEPNQDHRLNQVIVQLGLQAAVSKLKRGIETTLGKIKADGQDLSGGEWQRVAMARAVMSPAPVYILDEPTAALDPIGESKLYEQFEQITRNKTTLFISHRLGSTKLADEIFVIGDGRLLEHGSHEELMQKRGVYADMYEKQRSWYE